MYRNAYRAKPRVVDAIQYTGQPINEIFDWAGDIRGISPDGADLALITIAGEYAKCRVGDWIVREPVPGRFYPETKNVFATLYDRAPEFDDEHTEPEPVWSADSWWKVAP